MKLATILLLGILLLGSIASTQAADPTGTSAAALSFTGGAVYTSTGGICMWYPLLLGDLDQASLFAGNVFYAPAVDKEHAYLIWVSDFTATTLNPFTLPHYATGRITLQMIQPGEGTIYFTDRPYLRDWKDLEHNNRSTWGEPVAKFIRKAGVFQSLDGGYSGTVISSTLLVSSKPFQLNGKTFDFKDLIPHGMTCFETASGNDYGDDEAGTCLAIGGAQ